MNKTIAKSKFFSVGFTLIEFLVYIGILSIAIIAIGGVTSNIFQVKARTDAIQEVVHNGRFAMQKIGQAIELADAVILPEAEGDSLALEFKNGDKNPIVFDIFEKTLRVREGNRGYIELTTSRINVDSIKFRKISSFGVDSIQIEMNVSFRNPKGLPEYDFSNFFRGAFTLLKDSASE